MNTNIFNQKKEISLKLKNRYDFLRKNKCIWLIKLSDKNLIIDLRDALVNLPVSFVIEMNWLKEEEKLWKNIVATWKVLNENLIWFDFLICDKDISCLKKYLEKWIVPIISKQNPLKTILKDFNAIKNTWNAFLYEVENKWLIFEALVRYLENYKFPFDNKNLIKNILNI